MSSDSPRVCAVVLTHNRIATLTTCLARIAAQSRPPDVVFVVDNASSDGTPDFLAARTGVETLRSEENLGGAGGFALGLSEALKLGCDWYWALDDDSWPEPDCLRALLDGAARAPHPPDLMTSAVRWTDGRVHAMNKPWPRANRRAEFVETAARRLVAVRGATSVSTMVRREALERHGTHPAHYTIWVDDTEWTTRILRDGHGYLVPESVCVHATASLAGPADNSGPRFYFKVRNSIWMLRAGRSLRGLERFFYAVGLVATVRRYLRASDSRRAALATVARGVRDGLGREPR